MQQNLKLLSNILHFETKQVNGNVKKISPYPLINTSKEKLKTKAELLFINQN